MRRKERKTLGRTKPPLRMPQPHRPYLTLGGLGGVLPCAQAEASSVQGLPGGTGRKGVVAGHAVWLPGERWPLPSAAPPRTEAGQCGQEDLAEVGGDQVVEDGVDGRADVEESVGQHVEIVVEVEEEPIGGGERCLDPNSPQHLQGTGVGSVAS